MENFIKNIKESINIFLSSIVDRSNSNDEFIYCYAEKIERMKITNALKPDVIKSKNLFYFCKPDDKFEWVSFDQLLSLKQQNVNSLDPISVRYSNLKNKFLMNETAAGIKSIPSIQCQMKFTNGNVNNDWKNFPDFTFTIPKLLLLNENDQLYFILIFRFMSEIDFNFIEKLFISLAKIGKKDSSEKIVMVAGRDSKANEEKINWEKALEEGKQILVQEEIKKFVLSRKKEFFLSGNPNFSKMINQLRARYSNCFIFLTKASDTVFFGASPESFIKSKNDELVFEAVAGTVPMGNHIDEELFFEKRLIHDSKLKSEHEIVKEYILNKIHDLSPNQKISENSFIRKLDNIQHLVTKITIPFTNKTRLFHYINEIYPTPAVCGFPKDKAMRLINKLELHERGLYSGLLGWFDMNLNGELVVGIRSALSCENKITAYAGGGILSDSIPEEEFLETELKLQPILSLFENEEKS